MKHLQPIIDCAADLRMLHLSLSALSIEEVKIPLLDAEVERMSRLAVAVKALEDKPSIKAKQKYERKYYDTHDHPDDYDNRDY
jgi:hypothetical protein